MAMQALFARTGNADLNQCDVVVPLGMHEPASRLHNAWLRPLEDGVHPADLASPATPEAVFWALSEAREGGHQAHLQLDDGAISDVPEQRPAGATGAATIGSATRTARTTGTGTAGPTGTTRTTAAGRTASALTCG